MNGKHSGKRLYAVEILRTLLICGIIFGHVSTQIYPSIGKDFLAIFHTSRHDLWFGVDGFFIIGGFFLYRTIMRKRMTAFAHIAKLWGRLIPAMLLSFTIAAPVVPRIGWWQFVDILFMLPGTGLAREIIGNSEWFICVYFLVSCLIVGLFSISHKTAWTILVVLMYFTLMLQLHAKPIWFSNVIDRIYYTLISNGACKGIFCMGLGVLTSFLSEQFAQHGGKASRRMATGIEVVAFYMLLTHMFRTSLVSYTRLEMQCIFAVLVLCIAVDRGYLSALLNRMSWIQYISRYTYSFLFGHATMIACVRGGIQIHNTDAVAVVIIGAIVFALFEYHIIEGWLVPKMKLWFQGAPETNKSLE